MGISLVKNEEDIIEPFVRHNLQFLDLLCVGDNGSADATRDILIALQREGLPLVVFDDPITGYSQSEKMTRIVKGISVAIFPKYVVPLDADEFIRCDSRKRFLAALDGIPEYGAGLVPWVTYVITPSDLEGKLLDPPRCLRYRRSVENPQYSKAILRLDGRYHPSVELAQGNHAALRAGTRLEAEHLDGITIGHFPVRSADQLAAKAVVGWAAYLSKNARARGSNQGYQWRDVFDTVVAEGGISPGGTPALGR